MPTIIPRAYYCPKCKKEIKKKICDCGTKAKPLPPYSVRFRWINEDGMEEHKRIKRFAYSLGNANGSPARL